MMMFSAITRLVIRLNPCVRDSIFVVLPHGAVKSVLHTESKSVAREPISDDGTATLTISAKLATSFLALIGRTTYNVHLLGM